MTEPYPPPTPEERQLRAQRLAAGGAPAGPPVANPLAQGPGGGGLQGTTMGVPNYVWLLGISLVAVVGIVWWRSRHSSSNGGSGISATNPNSPVDASTAGLATDQYESLLALLNSIQGQPSTPGPTGPTGPAGPPGEPGSTPAPAPAPAPTPTPTSPAPVSQPQTYPVVSGDTLSGIASRFGTTWQNLYDLNRNIIDNTAHQHGFYSNEYNWIFPGERLVVPS